jgi:hypothetical protein
MKLSVTLITSCSPDKIKMTGHFHHLDVDFPESMLASPEKMSLKPAAVSFYRQNQGFSLAIF